MTGDMNGWQDMREEEREGLDAFEESGGDVPFLPDTLHDEDAAWRGVEHIADLPPHDGGPEEQMWRDKMAEEEARDAADLDDDGTTDA